MLKVRKSAKEKFDDEEAKKIVGEKLGLNLGATWAYLLKRNSKKKRRWDDARLLRWIAREFPNRQHRYFASTWRSYYNNGRISCKGKPTYSTPKKISLAYDSNGNAKTRQKGRARR